MAGQKICCCSQLTLKHLTGRLTYSDVNIGITCWAHQLGQIQHADSSLELPAALQLPC